MVVMVSQVLGFFFVRESCPSMPYPRHTASRQRYETRAFVRAIQSNPGPRVALKISFKKFIYMLILVQQKLLVHLYETLCVEAPAYSFCILLWVTRSGQL